MITKLKKKKILVFGNTGFVGSWLSLSLNLFGANVLGVSLKMKNSNYLSNTIQFKKNVNTIYCNIHNLNKIKKKINNFKPEIVVHLASQPLVSDGYKNPKKTFNTNIMGTLEILELIKNLKSLKKIIIFTSDKVYKNDHQKLNEDSKLGGIDPYSASKSCQDIISQCYNLSFLKKQMIILRSGNIIGGGDWADNRLIPDIIRAYKNNKKIKIRSIESTRPWLHILDVLSAIHLIINKKFKNKKINIFNLSPKEENQVSVKKILELIKEKTEIKSLKINVVKNKINEKKYLKLSSIKIKNQLGWQSKLNLVVGLILTVKLYLTKKNNLFLETKKQISNFFN